MPDPAILADAFDLTPSEANAWGRDERFVLQLEPEVWVSHFHLSGCSVDGGRCRARRQAKWNLKPGARWVDRVFLEDLNTSEYSLVPIQTRGERISAEWRIFLLWR
jgi:hypothetical protein